MLLLVLGLAWSLTCVDGVIPPTNVFYQHRQIHSACDYGNLTVAVVGKLFKPANCNGNSNITDWAHPPYIYINSTNATERFTVVIVDKGPTGSGPDYLQWMVTNVSINTPDFHNIPPSNVIADYRQPLLMYGATRPTLLQILVFRHQNTLRVPFGELWITNRNFSLSTLFSNTAPNLRLCGPVAGIQFWLHNNNPYAPSAPLSPFVPAGPPVYVPVVPVQPAYPPQTPPHQHPAHKKSLAAVVQPVQLLFVPLAICTILFL